MLNITSRRILAAIQAIIGLEWLNSGVNKIALGSFPQGLADALNDGLKDNPNDWYVSFLHSVVIPNSVFIGYCIEWVETLTGLALIGSAIILLGRVRKAGEDQYRFALGFSVAAMAAATLCILLCVNFHFYMGKGVVVPNFSPSGAFDEGIDLDAMLPLFGLVVIVCQWKLIEAMRGKPILVLSRVKAYQSLSTAVRARLHIAQS